MRGWFGLVAVLILSHSLWAAPLADRVPGDAMLYIGWQGAKAAGPVYEQSRLKQFVDAGDLAQTRGFLDRLIARIGQDDASAAEIGRALTPVIDTLWDRPAALYVGPSVVGAPKASLARAVLIVDAGPAAADITARIQAALAKQRPGGVVTVKTVGELVAVGDIDDALLNLLAGRAAGQPTLAASADFVAATKKVAADAAITGYISVDALRVNLDRSGGPGWATWRDALALQGVHSVAYSAGFDGKQWGTQAFVAAPAPRQGIATLLDSQPLSDQLLGVIPRNATLVMAGQFDLARLLQETRGVLAKADPRMQSQFSQALNMAKSMVGVDLEAQLGASLGNEWALYSAPGIGGARAFGWVLANRLRDPAGAEQALTNLENAISRMATSGMQGGKMQLPVYQRKQGNLTVHYFGVVAVSPAWTIQDGTLYIAAYPQVVLAAAQSAAAKTPSFLENPAIVDARKRSATGAVGIEFIDLPASCTDGYGTSLLVSQYALGLCDMMGVQAPTMLLPPLNKLQQIVTPSLSVSWADADGWHKRGTEPFPGSIVLSGDFSVASGMMQPAILAAIVIPQFTNASDAARHSAMMSMTQTLRAQFELYKLQHGDDYPDLVKYPHWEQLLQRTSEDGIPGPTGKYGPYLAQVPVNPLNNNSAMEVVNQPVHAGYRPAKPGIGWIFDTASHRIYATDKTGAVVMTP